MTEERVVIKVEIDADIGGDLAGIERRIKSLEDRTRSFNRESRDLDRNNRRTEKSFDRVNKALMKFGSTFGKFLKTLGKFSFIALAGQIGLFTAGLLAAKAALVTGRVAVKSYQIALKGLSIAAAAVATGLAVAAAAMREFQEAQLAPLLGGGAAGKKSAIALSRGIGSRMTGLLGGEATTAITGSLARAGVRGSQANSLVSQLYNITGGDAKAAQSLAAAFAGGDVKKAIQATQGAVGFKKDSLTGISTMSGLVSAVSGGGATADAFQGAGEAIAQTFVGTIKTEFAGIKGIFADVGEPLLGPFRNAFLQISKILREDILSLTAVVQRFGSESFAPTLVTIVDTVSEFVRSNIIGHLDTIENTAEKFVGFFKAISHFFYNVGNFLRQFEPAADVVIDMFKAMAGTAGGRGLFREFSGLIEGNAENFKEFGAAIGNVVGALLDLGSAGQGGFFAKLPTIIDALNRVASELVPALGKVLSAMMPLFEKVPDIISGLADAISTLAPVVEVLAKAIAALVGIIPDVVTGMMLLGGFGAVKALGFKGAGGMLSKVGGGIKTGAGFMRQSMRGGVGSQLSKNLLGKTRIGPGFAAAGTGTAVAGMGIAGAAIMGMGIKSAYDNGGGVGSMAAGIGGGALTGAAIGSVIPVVGTAVGAAVGAVVGGVATWFAGRKGKEKIRKATEEAMDKQLDTLANLDVLGMSSDEKMSTRASLVEQYVAVGDAISAGKASKFTAAEARRQSARRRIPLDVVLAETVGKDSEEFTKMTDMFQELGILGEKFDADEVFSRLPEYLSEAETAILAIDNAINRLNTNTALLTNELGLSEQQIQQFTTALGIDLQKNLGLEGLAGLAEIFFAPEIDRTQTFLPDFANTIAGRANKMASSDAALNALAESTRGGTYDVSLASDFVDRFAAAEMAFGADADIAGLSGVLELRQQAQAGAFGDADKFMQQFGISDMETGLFKRMSEAYGISVGDLREAYGSGNIDAVSNLINRTSFQRESLRTGIVSGDFGALAQGGVDISGAGFEDFRAYAGGRASEVYKDKFADGKIRRGIGGYMATQRSLANPASAEEFQRSLVAAVGEDESKRIMIDYLTASGDDMGAQTMLLQTISDNLAKPMISVNGQTTEERGGVIYQITIDPKSEE
jgi:hypothetical protein